MSFGLVCRVPRGEAANAVECIEGQPWRASDKHSTPNGNNFGGFLAGPLFPTVGLEQIRGPFRRRENSGLPDGGQAQVSPNFEGTRYGGCLSISVGVPRGCFERVRLE